MQYTIRNVPKKLDNALRKKAKAENRSLNETVLDVLQKGLGEPVPVRHHDYDHLAGTWVEDPAFDEAMKFFDQIDKPEDMS